jgi:TetR/AcrR family transcriptional regulator, lmrAB and yxaGH operons repressor
MPAVPKHRQPIVNAAVTLFRQQGYAGTGLNDIADVSSAPKGSLYHYFPEGKVSIAAAAVQEAGRRVAATVTELASTTHSSAQLLRAHARLLAGWMKKSRFRDGCPITTVLLALAPHDRSVAEAGRRAYAQWVSILRRRLVADGHCDDRAERLAILCVATLQGALIQARVARCRTPIEQATDELARMLEAARVGEIQARAMESTQ